MTTPSVTVRDVAAAAQVSPMTVSRTLAGGENVRPELQRRVWDAVESLGYRRNENARALRPGQASGLLGVAITNLANPYYGEFAAGVEEVAREHGKRILLGNSDEDEQRERTLVADFLGRRVEGLIVVPAAHDAAQHLSANALGDTPVVLASRLVSGLTADAVVLDDVGGARAATAALVDAGHRRIGYIGNATSVATGMRRFEGYAAALADAGIAVDDAIVSRGHQDVGAARTAMRALLALPEPPTAVFAANNRNAIGALMAIVEWRREHGGEGPAIAGFDDFELAELSPVPLTLVQHDPRELGRRAARLLLERDGDVGTRVETLPVRLRHVQPA